jgi:hypothetical protein
LNSDWTNLQNAELISVFITLAEMYSSFKGRNECMICTPLPCQDFCIPDFLSDPDTCDDDPSCELYRSVRYSNHHNSLISQACVNKSSVNAG